MKFIENTNKKEYVRVCSKKPRTKPSHTIRYSFSYVINLCSNYWKAYYSNVLHQLKTLIFFFIVYKSETTKPDIRDNYFCSNESGIVELLAL